MKIAIETIDIGAKTASAAAASTRPGSAAISSTTTAPVPARPCSMPIPNAWRGERTWTVPVRTARSLAQMPVVAMGVRGRPGAIVAAQPLGDHPDGQGEDHQPDAGLGAAFEPAGELRLEDDEREADHEQRRGMAHAPPRAEPGRGAHIALVGGDERGHGHEMVRVRRVPQPQHERDPERHQQRSALDQVGQPCVDRLDRLEEDVEPHQRAAATAACP